eukprot:TRINITY_DN605_c0_g2_i5.p1 TRINITY_DN605_c0_g2~~TRINITY_DN605_c0_g2_i5.p1  ORF type:complete len:198 (-),score=46.08 TRINITY_DN605_c0_g2_i5:703-1296(-)
MRGNIFEAMSRTEMHGNVYEAMADGVKKSKTMVALLSAPYEGSLNCKRELCFAADCKKPIVPVRLPTPADYTFGWAGLITAGELYTKIESVAGVKAAAQEIKQKVQTAKPSPQPTPLTLLESMPQTPKPEAKIEDMDVEGVVGLLKKWGLDEYEAKFREKGLKGTKLMSYVDNDVLLRKLVPDEDDRQLLRDKLSRS